MVRVFKVRVIGVKVLGLVGWRLMIELRLLLVLLWLVLILGGRVEVF